VAQVPVPAKRVKHQPQHLRMLVLQVRVPVKPVHMLIRQVPAPVTLPVSPAVQPNMPAPLRVRHPAIRRIVGFSH
ncbi:hypothetical protein PY75_13815, partial [Lacticaseibacillus rhamnosus]